MRIFLKTLFKSKRIIETDGKFIAQVFELDWFNTGWKGIVRTANDTYSKWDYQVSHCAVEDISAANQLCQEYSNFVNLHKQRVKEKKRKIVHEVEPEIWTILKTTK